MKSFTPRAPLPSRCRSEQLFGSMHARMAVSDRFPTAGSELLPSCRVGDQVAQHAGHLVAIARDEEILTRTEETLHVIPRRAHQRDAACQALEHADRWDAAQSVHILPPRNVDRDRALRV